MAKEKKDKHFIKKPIYPGGRTAMRKFIKENLRYPQKALDAQIEGTVSLRYAIDYRGKVTDAQIIAGLGHGCDEEAVRLVKLFQFKVPKTRKVRVLFHKDIHIHFKLPKRKPRTLRYQYATSSQHQSSETSTGSGSYHYTVTIRRGQSSDKSK